MKATNRNARDDKAAKHNDRNFNLDNAPHIDKSKTQENIYWTYNGDSVSTFREVEIVFYGNEFGMHVKKQNERNILERHPQRNKTIEEYHDAVNSSPEDKILQIGNMKEHATKEELWACAEAYRDQFEERYGDCCKILDMALHMDEKTPHVHVRRVWIGENKYGEKCVSQNKALEKIGVLPPDPTKPKGKYNNAKITFTKTDTALFQKICKEHGIEIDTEPDKTRVHLHTVEYKMKVLTEEIKKMEKIKEDMNIEMERSKRILAENESELEEVKQSMDNVADTMLELLNGIPWIHQKYVDELEEIRKKSRKERVRFIAALYKREITALIEAGGNMQEAYIKAGIEAGTKHIKSFIKLAGLEEDYKKYEQTLKDRITREQRDDIFI